MKTKSRKSKSQKAMTPSRKGANPQSSQAARRSLPALAEVQKYVVSLRDKARLLRDDAERGEMWCRAVSQSNRVTALNEVLAFIAGEEHEEPEGNTQALPEGGAHPH